MLIIRKEQITAFERIDPPGFEREMAMHIREHFPKHVDVLGEETILKVIRQGCERAKERGFTTRHEVCLFIDMSIILGHGFHNDPQLPWAKEILNDASSSDPTARIERLYDVTMEYLDQVVGKDEMFPVRPLRRMLEYPMQQMELKLAGGVQQGIFHVFQNLWPEKFSYVGQEALAQMCREGLDCAKGYGFSSKQAVGLYLILMFLLGHRFDTDPQYQILSEALNAEELSDETRKFGHFYGTLKASLTKGLS